MKAYSIDLRIRVMEYLDRGRTYQVATYLKNVNWSKLTREKGSLKFEHTPQSPHKLNNEAFLDYVKKNPDAYLREIAVHFKCGITSVHDALKRLGVKYKKTKNIS